MLDGFTIRGGTGTPLVDQLNHNTYVEGGGIIVDGGSPVIRNNIIHDNSVTRLPAGITSSGAGGIRVGFGSPRILNNVIAHNEGRYYGGGVVVNYANATLRNNVVINNSAVSSSGQNFGGGGVWFYGTGYTSTFDNNTVCGNSSSQNGGGVRVWVTHVNAKNNIVWNNNATTGSDEVGGATGDAQFTYSDIRGGRAGTGNIDLPPQFADSNLRLLASSPAVNAGDPDPALQRPRRFPQRHGRVWRPGRGRFPALHLAADLPAHSNPEFWLHHGGRCQA